ncbi:MAG: protein kinase domain-containing protein [Thermoanaerobaculia bacterium]
MTLAAGTRLGPYEITGALGAGGMGEVYKARDTRLERTVAIKVLPSHMSSSPDSRQRFEREAKTISQLSHPHICALHDVGREGETDYLVMEYLEGETLSERLVKGPLPLEQTLRFGIEIADALDKAHRQGIVHRDLKPGNVMLTKSGVKLLDFGLAKAMAPAPSQGSLTALPTQQGLTQEGTVLGTFQYMAPEQLEGKEADARTDIFAFGAVFYEMVAGRKAFTGATRASLITAIMSADPAPLSTIQPMSAPALDRVVKTCLAKDPEGRWQSAADLRNELSWIAQGASEVAAAVHPPAKARERLAWLIATLAAAGLVLDLWVLRRAPSDIHPVRFLVYPPEKSVLNSVGRDAGPVVISPDGRRLAFVATTSDGRKRLFVRPLESLSAQALDATDGASFPFWSADSRFIAFFAEGKLKKVEASGGAVQSLCDAPLGRGGTWNRGGDIVFAPGPYDPLFRVSSGGGAATPITAIDEKTHELSHRFPQFLPDGRHFLYLGFSTTVSLSEPNRSVYVGSLDSLEPKFLFRTNSRAGYAASGYLLFVREGNLLAMPFDVRGLRVSGEPAPIAAPVESDLNLASALFSTSENGALVYQAAGVPVLSQLFWFDREGRKVGADVPLRDCEDPRLSPDGRRVAVNCTGRQSGDNPISLYDFDRNAASRFTFSHSYEHYPSWSPDGSRIVFDSNRNGPADIFVKALSGAGGEQLLLHSKEAKAPTDWSPDGKLIVFQRLDPKTKWDLWALPASGGGKPTPVVQTAFNEMAGQLSPDGRWLAYASDESGHWEVYVTTFPGPGGKWQISTGGGAQPRWRRDGKEIFYLASDRKLMAADIKAEGSFAAGVPRPLFETQARYLGNIAYDVSADGQRFLINTVIVQEASPPLTVVLNWTEGLKQ